MSEQFRNLIGGKWLDASTGATFDSIDPANRAEVLGTFPRSNRKDVEEAVAAAVAAFPSWRRVPAPRRAEILYRAAELLTRRKEELARLMVREMGKVLKEARGDVQEAIDMTYFIAGEGRRLLGRTTPAELPDKFAMTVREPVGVVGIITPWNFPMAIPSWKIVPALLCGNTVVFKPAEDTPLCGLRFAEILLEAGIPDGVLNLVFGIGEEAGAALVRHRDVALISFTGSTETGRLIALECARDLKRLSLEMGGKNPIVVMEDADLDLAVDGAVWSAFGTSGQRCTAGSRIIVHHDVVQAFTARLVDRARTLRLGNGLDEKTDLGPLINEAQLQRVHSYVKVGQEEGAELLCGGEVAAEGELARGYFYQPTVFANVKPAMRIAQEEIFGPVTAIIPVASFREAVEVVNGTQYGLSSSIYTRDVNRAFQAMREFNAGIVYVNAGTIGAEVHLPFGGTRATGNGHREGGEQVLDVFTEWKSIYVDYSGRLQKAQIDRG
ncbi:MAG: aldehyde dehydrogenase family protein [Deltaproteobacteria bacterium]|nr:aldehyde dehydrogenase family protein [Deltaproteobacteria bacterium]